MKVSVHYSLILFSALTGCSGGLLSQSRSTIESPNDAFARLTTELAAAEQIYQKAFQDRKEAEEVENSLLAEKERLERLIPSTENAIEPAKQRAIDAKHRAEVAAQKAYELRKLAKDSVYSTDAEARRANYNAAKAGAQAGTAKQNHRTFQRLAEEAWRQAVETKVNAKAAGERYYEAIHKTDKARRRIQKIKAKGRELKEEMDKVSLKMPAESKPDVAPKNLDASENVNKVKDSNSATTSTTDVAGTVVVPENVKDGISSKSLEALPSFFRNVILEAIEKNEMYEDPETKTIEVNKVKDSNSATTSTTDVADAVVVPVNVKDGIPSKSLEALPSFFRNVILEAIEKNEMYEDPETKTIEVNKVKDANSATTSTTDVAGTVVVPVNVKDGIPSKESLEALPSFFRTAILEAIEKNEMYEDPEEVAKNIEFLEERKSSENFEEMAQLPANFAAIEEGVISEHIEDSEARNVANLSVVEEAIEEVIEEAIQKAIEEAMEKAMEKVWKVSIEAIVEGQEKNDEAKEKEGKKKIEEKESGAEMEEEIANADDSAKTIETIATTEARLVSKLSDVEEAIEEALMVSQSVIESSEAIVEGQEEDDEEKEDEVGNANDFAANGKATETITDTETGHVVNSSDVEEAISEALQVSQSVIEASEAIVEGHEKGDEEKEKEGETKIEEKEIKEEKEEENGNADDSAAKVKTVQTEATEVMTVEVRPAVIDAPAQSVSAESSAAKIADTEQIVATNDNPEKEDEEKGSEEKKNKEKKNKKKKNEQKKNEQKKNEQKKNEEKINEEKETEEKDNAAAEDKAAEDKVEKGKNRLNEEVDAGNGGGGGGGGDGGGEGGGGGGSNKKKKKEEKKNEEKVNEEKETEEKDKAEKDNAAAELKAAEDKAAEDRAAEDKAGEDEAGEDEVETGKKRLNEAVDEGNGGGEGGSMNAANGGGGGSTNAANGGGGGSTNAANGEGGGGGGSTNAANGEGGGGSMNVVADVDNTASFNKPTLTVGILSVLYAVVFCRPQ